METFQKLFLADTVVLEGISLGQQAVLQVRRVLKIHRVQVVERIAHSPIFVLTQQHLAAIWKRHLLAGVDDERTPIPDWNPRTAALVQEQRTAPPVRVAFRARSTNRGIIAFWREKMAEMTPFG